MNRVCLLAISVAPIISTWPAARIRAQTSADLEPVKLSTKPVDLKTLVAKSDRIFLGEVVDIKTEPRQLRGVEKKINIRTVTFKIEEIYKDKTDSLKVGKPYDVHQLPEISREVRKGQRLLWYLAPNHPETGLTQPVGVDSGHFRVMGKGKRAMNLKGNKDLFDVEEVRRVRENLKNFLQDESKFDAVEQEIARWRATEFRKPGNDVSLDLLIGRTKMILADKQ